MVDGWGTVGRPLLMCLRPRLLLELLLAVAESIYLRLRFCCGSVAVFPEARDEQEPDSILSSCVTQTGRIVLRSCSQPLWTFLKLWTFLLTDAKHPPAKLEPAMLMSN